MRIQALFGLLLFLGPLSLAAQPAVSFDGEAVLASGLTPGGRVVWFSVARESSESSARIVRREEIVVADGGGESRFELGRAVPLRSIWVAVDLASGGWAVAAPEGFPLRLVDPPGRDAVPGESGEPDFLEDSRGYVEVLVVRPGEGAWGLPVGDGGADDEDGVQDGRLVASLPHLRGVEGSAAAPERFASGDVLILIDPNEMDVTVRRLTEAPR